MTGVIVLVLSILLAGLIGQQQHLNGGLLLMTWLGCWMLLASFQVAIVAIMPRRQRRGRRR